MCQTDNLQSMMTTTKIISIIHIVAAVALLIAGAVAASYSLPKWCAEETTNTFEPDDPGFNNWEDYQGNDQCEDDYNGLNAFVKLIALWGTLPGIIPLVFGIFGVWASIKKAKWMSGVLLAFTIIGCILCLIGIFLPFIGASVFTSVCEADWDPDNPSSGDIRSTKDGKDFCDRYAGSLWAVVVLNIILTILQFAFSIVLCCLCCANQSLWDQANGGAVPGIQMQPMGGAPANVPVQPAYNQPAPAYNQQAQSYIPEATPVK